MVLQISPTHNVTILDLGLLARIVRLLLQSLTELQQRIVHDFLLPLEVTTDDFPIVEFAVAPCPEGLEFPSYVEAVGSCHSPNSDEESHQSTALSYSHSRPGR